MRFLTMPIILIASFLIVGYALMPLLNWGDPITTTERIFTTTDRLRFLFEIAIGILAILIVAKVCDGLWRTATLICLGPMAIHRLWFLWMIRSEGLPWDLELYLCAVHFAPPFILLGCLWILPNARERGIKNDAEDIFSFNIFVRIFVLLAAVILLLFAAFKFATGQDILGRGHDSLATSFFGIGGGVAALLYGLNMRSFYQRAITIGLTGAMLALLTCRTLERINYLIDITPGGWACFLIDVVPPVLIFTIALVHPFVPSQAMQSYIDGEIEQPTSVRTD